MILPLVINVGTYAKVKVLTIVVHRDEHHIVRLVDLGSRAWEDCTSKLLLKGKVRNEGEEDLQVGLVAVLEDVLGHQLHVVWPIGDVRGAEALIVNEARARSSGERVKVLSNLLLLCRLRDLNDVTMPERILWIAEQVAVLANLL